MPVARIISSSFEDALRFADYLRPLFDTVEIAQPGRASTTAVDLEVNLELFTPQEAWRQIAELSQQPESEIMVAPGTLFAEGEGESGVSAPAEAIAGLPLELEAHGEVEAAIAQASAMAATAAGSNGSGTHKAEVSPIVPEAELNWLGRVRESLQQWLAVRGLLREIRQMRQQELARERNRQRQMALQFERERREREAQALAMAPPPPPSPAQTWPDAAGMDAVPLSEPQSFLQAPAEEEPLGQAEQEEAIRRGAFVEEILRRRAEEEMVEAAPATFEAEAAPVEFQAVPAESFLDAPEMVPVTRFSVSRNRRWQPAMALAGVTSVLLMAVIMGYAHRRPASPVPLAVLQRSNEVEQKVPFGPASVPAPASEPTAASPAPVQEVPAVAPAPERHSFQNDFRRIRVDRHEVDYVSDDVTVRHFNNGLRRAPVPHPVSAVPVTASTRGVKQISDMD